MNEQKHFIPSEDEDDELQEYYDSVRKDIMGDMPAPNEWADGQHKRKAKDAASDIPKPADK